MKRRWKCVYLKSSKEYGGFTLIECVVALFIIASVCIFLLAFTSVTKQLNRYNYATTQIDWHIFLIQLERETKNSTFLGVKEGALEFREKDTKITVLTKIESKNNVILKSKNRGYHPMLMNVKKYVPQEIGDKVQIEVEFNNGDNYQSILFFEKEK